MRPLCQIVFATLGLVLLMGCNAQTAAADASASATSAPPKLAKRTKADDEMIGLAISGVDHFPEHLSIQEFWVNGTSGAQAGDGSRGVCCVTVPRKWRPGLKVTVHWGVLNWRDRAADEYETVVEVEPYGELDRLYVHFLPDGSVRAIVSSEGPGSPTYIGPHALIPRKNPWDRYDLPGGTPLNCVNHTVTPPEPCKD